MATDDPLREVDLPPELRDHGSDKSRSQKDDQYQPMIGDLVHRPGESSGYAARDAMMRPSDPQGNIEQLGLATPPASDAGARDDARQPEREEATAIKPPSAADKPPAEDAVSAGKSASAAAAGASAEESIRAAPDTPLTASPAAPPVSDEASDDGGASLAAADESLPADGPTAESMDDSADAVALDSSPAATADEPAVAADSPSTPGNSSATSAPDAPAPATADSPPSAPAASPGLAPEQVTSAARSQPQEGELPQRTTDLLTPGPDGQPPMARPIVLVRLTDDVTHRMINDALAKVSADDSALMESIAADHVDYIFWQIRAQERAILRFD